MQVMACSKYAQSDLFILYKTGKQWKYVLTKMRIK